MKNTSKPQPDEFAPYASLYIDLVPDDGQVLQHMHVNFVTLRDLVRDLPDEKLSTPCAEGEWTIKEILVHVMDTERIWAYRALRFARNDTTELSGFNHEHYVPESNANARSIGDILEEYAAVRAASLAMFKSFDDAMLTRSGIASRNPLSVRAAAYQIVGHEIHHLNSIRENYL